MNCSSTLTNAFSSRAIQHLSLLTMNINVARCLNEFQTLINFYKPSKKLNRNFLSKSVVFPFNSLLQDIQLRFVDMRFIFKLLFNHYAAYNKM